MAGPISRYVAERIEKLVNEHRVLVWYDSGGSFSQLASSLSIDSCVHLRLEDSYFELRSAADKYTAGFRHGDAPSQTLLVYVPRSPLPPKEDLLLPIEVLGRRFDRSLRQEASTALKRQVPAAKLQDWFAIEGLTLEQLDDLAGTSTDIGPLALVFEDATPSQVGWQLLREPDKAARVCDHKQEGPLRELLKNEFGVVLPKNATEPQAVRDAFAERVLLYEFLDDLEEIPKELESHELPAATCLAACRELAARLRDSKSVAESYVRWATDTEESYGLAGIDYDAAKLGRRDTFSFEERLALGYVHHLAVSGVWKQAQQWVRDRQDSFWTRHLEKRQAEWRVAELAVELWLTASELLASMPKSGGAAGWVRWYVGRSDRGWTATQHARKLSALRTSWLDEPNLSEIASMALGKAADLERLTAEHFTDALAADPQDVENLPQQLHVFAGHVAPSIDAGRKTALVLADALRYEMGQEIADLLQETGEAEVGFAIAACPTITKIGMAALAPGAENGLSLSASAKQLVPIVGGNELKGLADRRIVFAAAYGDRVGEITLDDCIGANQKKLRALVNNSDLLLLLSQDIDELGETDKVYRTANLVDQVISSLHQAIRRLANAGVEQFVIVADHGFLLRDDITDAMKIPCPSGEIVESHRRCVIGRELDKGDHHVVVRAADLGLGGDLEIAFPRGVNVFTVSGGNLAYLHGGVSLQELVIPVLRYTPAAARRTSSPPSIELQAVRTPVANRYFQVTLSYQAGDLFDQDDGRQFVIEATVDGEVVGRAQDADLGFQASGNAIELRNGEQSTVMMGITAELDGSGSIELRVIDNELGEIVKRETLPYEFAF